MTPTDHSMSLAGTRNTKGNDCLFVGRTHPSHVYFTSLYDGIDPTASEKNVSFISLGTVEITPRIHYKSIANLKLFENEIILVENEFFL